MTTTWGPQSVRSCNSCSVTGTHLLSLCQKRKQMTDIEYRTAFLTNVASFRVNETFFALKTKQLKDHYLLYLKITHDKWEIVHDLTDHRLDNWINLS